MITLSQGLQAVFDAMERTKLEEFDGDKKSEWMVYLQTCITVAAKIEENFGLPDLAEDNESLNTKLQSVEAEFESYKSNSEAQIKVLQSKLDALLNEKAQREKKDPELPSNQFRILQYLPHANGGTLTLNEIINGVQIEADEVGIHLDRLQKDGYAYGGRNRSGQMAWNRTIKGDKYVVAKRLAEEDEPAPVKEPQSKLSPAEEEVLKFLITKIPDGVGESLVIRQFGMRYDQGKLLLENLKGSGLAHSRNGFDEGVDELRVWRTTVEGRRYFG